MKELALSIKHCYQRLWWFCAIVIMLFFIGVIPVRLFLYSVGRVEFSIQEAVFLILDIVLIIMGMSALSRATRRPRDIYITPAGIRCMLGATEYSFGWSEILDSKGQIPTKYFIGGGSYYVFPNRILIGKEPRYFDAMFLPYRVSDVQPSSLLHCLGDYLPEGVVSALKPLLKGTDRTDVFCDVAD